MAILTGNNGVVKVENNAGTQVPLAAVRSFSVEITSDTIEKTTMTNDTRQYLKGLGSWSGNADIYFNPTEYPTSTTGLIALNPTGSTELVGGDTVLVEFFLNDTSNKFSGECIVTGFTVNSSMDGMVEASISFQGSGACTFA
jgi:predicted secreted protein